MRSGLADDIFVRVVIKVGPHASEGVGTSRLQVATVGHEAFVVLAVKVIDPWNVPA